MADPVTLLCSILTIADSSKKVLDVCKYYVSHAKNAPKELHRIIEDVNALEQTVRKLDRVAKSARRTAETSGRFDEWNVPSKRLEGHAEDLTKIIDRQDMKTGFFHELTFRARWPSAWREIRGLLSGISSEKQNTHLETIIYGLEMMHMVHELVGQGSLDKHLPAPPDGHYDHSDIVWCSVDQRSLTMEEQQTEILKQLGQCFEWHTALYDYPWFENVHRDYSSRCQEHSCDDFLKSDAYQKWKNPRTRGPGLLCAQGPAIVGKSIYCSQLIEDLLSCRRIDTGVAYFYFRNEMRAHGRQWSPYDTLRFWIMQLALQLRIVPHASSILARSTSEERALMKVLMSLLSQFRRTFFVIDGLYKTYSQMLAILGRILEQDYGNVSVAVFHGESNSPLESLTKFADVSIHVSAIEPNLQQYVHSKVIKLVGPALLDAVSQNSQANPSLGEIEEVIVEASDGLYLAVDIHIDSLLETIRARRDIATFLRNIHENNEIMLQRDHETKSLRHKPNTSIGGPEHESKRDG